MTAQTDTIRGRVDTCLWMAQGNVGAVRVLTVVAMSTHWACWSRVIGSIEAKQIRGADIWGLFNACGQSLGDFCKVVVDLEADKLCEIVTLEAER